MAKKHELTHLQFARLGGLAVSRDRAHMRKIGRRGGKTRAAQMAVARKQLSPATVQ